MAFQMLINEIINLGLDLANTGKPRTKQNNFGGMSYMLGSPNYPATSYGELITQGYLKNPDVYAAVSLIARACKTVKYYFVQQRSDMSEIDIMNPELIRLFRRPSKSVTFPFLVESVIVDYLLSGNAYLHKLKGTNGKVIEFYRIRPDRLTAKGIPRLGEPILEYWYQSGADRVAIPADDIIHFKNFDPLNENFGISPMIAAFRSVILGNSAIDWNTSVSQNMGRISGMMKFKDMLTEEQVTQIEQRFEGRNAGSKNAGKPMITDMDADFIPMAMNPVDADWVNSMNLSKQQIAAVYGIDSGLIGDKTASTYNNQETAMLRLYYDQVIPILDSLSDLLSTELIQDQYKDVYLRFNSESIEAIKKEQTSAFEKIDKINFLTINEKRAEMGYERLNDPALDTIYLNSSMVPANELSVDANIMVGIDDV